MSTKNPFAFEELFGKTVHENATIDVVATVSGNVKVNHETAGGMTIAVYELSPDRADELAQKIQRAAKMARAAVEPTAPPGPEERP